MRRSTSIPLASLEDWDRTLTVVRVMYMHVPHLTWQHIRGRRMVLGRTPARDVRGGWRDPLSQPAAAAAAAARC